jgi:hypothetical protein
MFERKRDMCIGVLWISTKILNLRRMPCLKWDMREWKRARLAAGNTKRCAKCGDN